MKRGMLIKKLFKRQRGRYEIWDTSALSNHFDDFKRKLQSDEEVTLVIPEGVSHEISVGRKNNDNCKEIYRLIEGNVRNPRLIIEVTPDSIRSWAVDEQVIYTASHYQNNGYETILITCDRDQSFRAKLKNLHVEFVPAVKSKNESVDQKEVEISVSLDKTPVIVPVKKSVEEQEKAQDVEISFPSKMMGKQCLLIFNKYISVYDRRGKRKIPNSQGVFVSMGDKVCYNNVLYFVKAIGSNQVTLQLCNSIT